MMFFWLIPIGLLAVIMVAIICIAVARRSPATKAEKPDPPQNMTQGQRTR